MNDKNELPKADIPLWNVECLFTNVETRELESREQVMTSETLSAVVDWSEKHLRSQYGHIAADGVAMTIYQYRPLAFTTDRNGTVWTQGAQSRTVWSTEYRWNENEQALSHFG